MKRKRSQLASLMVDLKQAGADSFLVNIIQNWHSQPTRKLRGLLALTRAGKQVRTAQFAIDVLLVDGERENWTLLDVWGMPATLAVEGQ
jgi:hypothetical protein